MNLRTHIEDIQRGSINCEEATLQAIEQAEKLNKKYSFFTTTTFDLAKQQAHQLDHTIQNHNNPGKIAGVFIGTKDALCIKEIETRAGSAILNGYKPHITATAVQRLFDNGSIHLGKTAQDEFGFGSYSTNVGNGFPTPLNPYDPTRTCGGSSGGAAALTASATFPHIAIAESTGGSIVNPAAFCGVVGLCPTYGRVSRYGLIDYANSLDKIGPIGKTVEDVTLALELMAGHDPADGTSSTQPVQPYSQLTPNANIRIGIVKEAFEQGVDEHITHAIKQAIQKFIDAGAQAQETSLPLAYKYSLPAYYIIAMTEASTNLARYTGLLYGASTPLGKNFREHFTNTRTEHFGQEAKRRIILGTFARMTGWRDAYYLKALKARQLIIEEYKQAFKQFDILITPTMPFIAPKLKDIQNLTPLQQYTADVLTTGVNLAGLPHMTMPCGLAHNMPIGMMLTAPHFKEDTLIKTGLSHEQQ